MKKLLIILLCFPMIGFGQCIPTDGCENGEVIYTWSDGENYVGNWKDGKQNGQGANFYMAKYIDKEIDYDIFGL